MQYWLVFVLSSVCTWMWRTYEIDWAMWPGFLGMLVGIGHYIWYTPDNRICISTIGCGILCNFLAISANDGKMPVAGRCVEEGIWKPLDGDSRLTALADILPYNFSIGDCLIILGVVGVIFNGFYLWRIRCKLTK